MAKSHSRKTVIPAQGLKGGFRARPNPGLVHLQHAVAAHLAGRLNDAEEGYKKVLSHDRKNAIAYSNLGALFKTTKRLDEAESHLRRALELDPDFADAHSNMGALLEASNRMPEAESSFRRALEIKPDCANATLSLANLLMMQKRFRDAFDCYTKAVGLKPADATVLTSWAQALKHVANSCMPYDQNVFDILSRWLSRPETFVSDYARPAYQLLKYPPVFNGVLVQAFSEQWEKDLDYPAAAKSLSSIPLLAQIMALSHAIDPVLETMFSRLRSAMLRALPGMQAGGHPQPFSVSLAMFCFNNDYVFAESEQEKPEIASLAAEVLDSLDEGTINWHAVVALSSFRPLHLYSWSERLASHALPEHLAGLIRQQVLEPAEEQRIRGNIPKLGRINDSTSCAVQQMYQGSPYPRWVKPTFSHAAASFSSVLEQDGCGAAMHEHRFGPESKILIAGCGTGQQSMMASSRYPSSQVTAVDLSLTSLAYAMRKSMEHGIANVRYLHGDLLELASLDEKFDVIECAGVLHHMADPMAGWRSLVDVLKPGGIMKIALYSERARETIVKIRGMIADRRLTSEPDDIRRLRQDILSRAASGDAQMQALMGVRDFFSLNECKDLLFHVQEHRFSFHAICSMIRDLGLNLLGLALPSRGVLEQFFAINGVDADPKNLTLWDEYEKSYPATFMGMYVFWVSKNPAGEICLPADRGEFTSALCPA